jgi:hypothetical protein
VDGEGVSAILTWDSKVLTVVSLLGGVQDLVRERMKKDGTYNEFIQIAEVRAWCLKAGVVKNWLTSSQREYSMVFGDELKGEHMELCLPDVPIRDAGLEDFTTCAKN